MRAILFEGPHSSLRLNKQCEVIHYETHSMIPLLWVSLPPQRIEKIPRKLLTALNNGSTSVEEY